MKEEQKYEKYMKRCLELAKNGTGNVAPNPMVGCIIVADDKIIGEGYHIQYGKPHAEVNAIESVIDKSLLTISTLYVNLEPCSHHGKTPPCSEKIIKSGIKKVVIGAADSNPCVNGQGISNLKSAGIDVITGVIEEECRFLNRRFYTYFEKNRPYIILKWAQTADKFIDIERKEDFIPQPTIISGEFEHILDHKWRSEEQAIMVGRHTVEKDNPLLTNRNWVGKTPIRIILDKNLKIPSDYNIYNKKAQTIVFNSLKTEILNNIEYIKIDYEQDTIEQILKELFNRRILSVIIEGGRILLESFIKKNLWDEARIFETNKYFNTGVKAPEITKIPYEIKKLRDNYLKIYYNNN
jgi:diaminohydroxyphosphoribosylaminopyrimidine deaminase/5-amino-6-(5-phosphoribosylamino)uracil reductase